jgi:succinyl-diaminopimelate desuccinylase
MVDTDTVSGREAALAGPLAAQLGELAHLEVLRDGDTVVARTNLGRAERVIVAGHIDTVPAAGNIPGRMADDGATLVGRGAVDMKGGLAVLAHLAAVLDQPRRDVPWVFYDHEEVAESLNGLGRVMRRHPDWVDGVFGVLAEPTAAGLEGGCNGSVRVEVTAGGRAAHAARSWMGANAIHAAAPILDRLAAYRPATVTVDGLDYREGLNAVGIVGGIASNVVPDRCTVDVNYRFAPDKAIDEAVDRVSQIFQDFGVEVVDAAPGARPGLDAPPARQFAEAVRAAGGGEPRAKQGWTDVARLAQLGIPAVNCGPGDPTLAHADNESCPVDQIRQVAAILKGWLM